MDINEYIKVKHKKINKYHSNEKKFKYFKNLISRVLVSIILVLIMSIFIKVDKKNKLLIDKYFFSESLPFSKINKWYQDKLGSIIPSSLSNSEMVFSNNDFKNNKYSNYLNGVKFEISKNNPVSLLTGGIVIYVGEKEGYGNTLIIQGNDGIDYWYGGITNLNVNLYDYLEKDTLVGETKDDYLYLVLEEDGKYISYDEYLKKT